jgi:hypothetical protein
MTVTVTASIAATQSSESASQVFAAFRCGGSVRDYLSRTRPAGPVLAIAHHRPWRDDAEGGDTFWTLFRSERDPI